MRRRVFYLFFLITLFSLLFTGCDDITEPDTVNDPTIPDSYELVWEDDFDGSTLNQNYWGYDLGYGYDGWGNDEWQQYTNAAENIFVEDGNMVISAQCPSGNPGKRDGSVTSARIKTQDKISFKFGKVQAKIKAPTGTGMWPAFWMLGNSFESAGWPYCGEIDIMEISPLLHGENTTLCTMHWWDEDLGGYNSYGTHRELDVNLADDYHIYEVEWDEQRIIGKIDNIIYFTKIIDPITMNEFLQEFFLIFNVAVGGNLGGAPDATTIWPQQMLVDWVRVYKTEESLIPIETYGIFTDETPVDAALTIGVDAEVYVWENTLTPANIPPYEGEGVLAWQSTGAGWFGGGISSVMPLDFTSFEAGTLNFMIKIPADVTFKIGINDTQGNENYVTFPAGQTAFGLTRDGEWGQAIIPVATLKGGVNLQMLSYEFIILEENGASCELAIDDIYYDGGGSAPGSVSFDAETYSLDDSEALVTVSDEAASGSTVSVSVDNGTDAVSLDIGVDLLGIGTGTLYFGETSDETGSIAIAAGETLTVTYVDFSGDERTDTAIIENEPPPPTDGVGIYSESHTEDTVPYIQIINSADWSGNSAVPDPENTAVTPVDGSYVLGVEFSDLGAGWGGIAFDFGSQDISDMENLIFSINKSAMPALVSLGIKLEDNGGGENEINISTYTPVISGDWAKYQLPLSAFSAVDLADLKYLGIWSPKDSSNNLLFSTLYFDDIYLDGEVIDPPPPVDGAGIFSETYTETTIPYTQIINSADWSGNSTVPDEESTAVTPVDGSFVLSATYEDLGAGWGGIAFDFSSQNISSYSKLIMNINTTEMPDLAHFGIKLEDSSGGNTEVDLFNYTPVVNGEWATYELPLSAFTAVNLSDLKYLGLWNPKTSSNTMIFGTLYFDDIHLTE